MSRGANWCPKCGHFYPASTEHDCETSKVIVQTPPRSKQ